MRGFMIIIVGYGFNFFLIQVKSGQIKCLQFSVWLIFAIDLNNLHRIFDEWNIL